MKKKIMGIVLKQADVRHGYRVPYQLTGGVATLRAHPCNVLAPPLPITYTVGIPTPSIMPRIEFLG